MSPGLGFDSVAVRTVWRRKLIFHSSEMVSKVGEKGVNKFYFQHSLADLDNLELMAIKVIFI